MEPTKERIEKEAADYASEIYNRDVDRLHWQNRRNGFLTGYERAQQELQAYRDNLKNAIAGRDLTYFEILELIDTETPT